MPKLQFSVKPAIIPALLPYYARWLWRFAIASLLVYGGVRLFMEAGVLEISHTRLVVALTLVSIFGTFSSVKHHMFRLHATTYLFYDTHVVRETRFISVRRRSMPYAHINKVTNDSTLWQRLIGVTDIILHSYRNAENDLVLNSVRRSDELEHEIYRLMKGAKVETEEAPPAS